MRVALCQINTTVGDLAGNAARIEAWYRRAAGDGADLVVFPELALTGYPPRDLLDLTDFQRAVRDAVHRLAGAAGAAGLVFGAPLANPGASGKPLYNAALLCAGGRVRHQVRKKLLPTYDVFDEGRYFEPDHDEAFPVEFGGLRWGLHICEDAWNQAGFWPRRLYHRDPVAELAGNGADILLNISASPFHGNKGPLRRSIFRSHCERHRLPLLYTNLVGGNDELIFDGEAFVFDAVGALLASGRPFEEEILVVEVEVAGDGGGGTAAKAGAGGGADAGVPAGRAAGVTPLVSRAFSEASDGGGRIRANAGRPDAPAEIHPEPEEMESIRRALVLGLRDYARKCGFRSAVLGLSGGIDSGLTAALAAEALGPDRVWGIAMPSRYSTPGSLTDAEAVAENLGIRYEVLPVEPVFQVLLEALRPLFAATASGPAEENLQARARAVMLMGLSNKFGHLLLSTGNKSELAVGYCTLYGDMAGGLAVIGDLPKTTVYALARHLNRERAVFNESILTKPPSAELKPDQTDQDSLPPYEMLDEILERYVEKWEREDEMIAGGLPAGVVHRVVSMLTHAEYKRRQAAPGLKISPKAFGSGRRMPIASRWPPDRR